MPDLAAPRLDESRIAEGAKGCPASFAPREILKSHELLDLLFDVLAHVAYALPPLTREVRAASAKVYINTQFNAKQQVLLDFVLQHYVNVLVEELDQDKLTPLLRLKYHDSIADAVVDDGDLLSGGTVLERFPRHGDGDLIVGGPGAARIDSVNLQPSCDRFGHGHL